MTQASTEDKARRARETYWSLIDELDRATSEPSRESLKAWQRVVGQVEREHHPYHQQVLTALTAAQRALKEIATLLGEQKASDPNTVVDLVRQQLTAAPEPDLALVSNADASGRPYTPRVHINDGDTVSVELLDGTFVEGPAKWTESELGEWMLTIGEVSDAE